MAHNSDDRSCGLIHLAHCLFIVGTLWWYELAVECTYSFTLCYIGHVGWRQNWRTVYTLKLKSVYPFWWVNSCMICIWHKLLFTANKKTHEILANNNPSLSWVVVNRSNISYFPHWLLVLPCGHFDKVLNLSVALKLLDVASGNVGSPFTQASRSVSSPFKHGM